MSQSFKLKYDELKDNDPTPETPADRPSRAFEEFYPDDGHMRNLCFVQLDGKRLFLNYSYLVSGEFAPDANTITVTFTTHSVILKGVNLENLFYDIMHQLAKQITCADARYNLIGEGEEPVVNEIVIKNEK